MSNVIKTTGRFVRFFSTFEEGLKALRELSYSASQALGDATDEESAVSHLATNVAFDRPTGNGVGWAQCSVRIDAYGIEYCTRGDLRFGWKVSPEWRGGFDLSRVEKRFSFFITHPRGENIPLDSSLGVSAREHGWNEVFEDGYAREPRAYEPRPEYILVRASSSFANRTTKYVLVEGRLEVAEFGDPDGLVGTSEIDDFQGLTLDEAEDRLVELNLAVAASNGHDHYSTLSYTMHLIF